MTNAVIFDMDGLLIDTEPTWREVEIAVFASVGVTLTEEMCRETMGHRADQAVQYWFERRGWSGKTPQQVEKEIIDSMQIAISQRAQPMPGALEAIAFVRSKGLKTAIASSSPQRLIEAMVQRFSLHASFDALHSAEHEVRGKPDPAVYLGAARRLGVSPDQCLAVEDSIAGMKSAKTAGMLCCAVPDPSAHLADFLEADVVIDSLKSFPRTLERIL